MVLKNWNTKDELISLEEEMTDVILRVRDEIIRSGNWFPCPATRAAEAEIERIQKEILAGNGKISDFEEVCEKWKTVGIKPIEAK